MAAGDATVAPLPHPGHSNELSLSRAPSLSLSMCKLCTLHTATQRVLVAAPPGRPFLPPDPLQQRRRRRRRRDEGLVTGYNALPPYAVLYRLLRGVTEAGYCFSPTTTVPTHSRERRGSRDSEFLLSINCGFR